ncbi:MAG: site-specific tyrosine recombinase XerD [Pseudomonadales bacterium]|nr:site-specific tyrosine recombinase XerD [Pseudomonadales bacterium]
MAVAAESENGGGQDVKLGIEKLGTEKLGIRKSDQQIIDAFVDSLWLEKNLSQNTLNAYHQDLKAYRLWLENQGLNIIEAGQADILAYLAQRLGEGIGARSIARALSCLRSCYRYLLREKQISVDPTLRIDNPKLGRSLPDNLTELEVEKLLAAPDTELAIGLRDRAMLEVLYAGGLRVTELVSLQLTDINLKQGVLRIMGKGSKERLVPLGEEAIDWLQQFLMGARIELLRSNQYSDVVFPSTHARQMTRQTFWHRIKIHAHAAGIERKLSPHTLRHAFATHLLNHGADLRVVQLLLGHSSLSTTQIYTHIAQHRMKQLHAAHHPRG